MDDLKVDAREWPFLGNPDSYIKHGTGGLQVEPLRRQFKTAKNILKRFEEGRGVLLADDVGLGKTTIGALVAWVFASQNKRVRIYAPNEVLRRRWAEELERHVPMLQRLGGLYNSLSNKRIRQGEVKRLDNGYIQVATHYALVKSRGNNKPQTGCDLMIIDEAHRAKGEGSAFNKALVSLPRRAKQNQPKRKLILTATPFSIDINELKQLLKFVGAQEKDLKAVESHAEVLKKLYELGDRLDVAAETERLIGTAKDAINQIKRYVIRHGIDDLSAAERQHYGSVGEPWKIATPSASQEDITLLLRMDRLLQLAPEREGERRNDPRFHVGWQHVATELDRVAMRSTKDDDHGLSRHIEEAKKSLIVRLRLPHPKIVAVTKAIRLQFGDDEKVLVFCHHRSTASELLSALEKSLKADKSCERSSEIVWREAWESLLTADKIWPSEEERPASYGTLMKPVVDWLCTKGLRRQIAGWLGKPVTNAKVLAEELSTTKPRKAVGEKVATIAEAAKTLVKVLLDEQSKSTRALLRSISRKTPSFGGRSSHFPGRLDEGLRVMGSWDHDALSEPPTTLYTGKPDIVLALFNSPFGPDVLVATDRLSEGVDLHRCCRHLIHYELDPSPVRTLQRNGRVRRVSSWAALTERPICYAYPTFGGTRDEKAADIMRRRIAAFGLLLGGVPVLEEEASDNSQRHADEVLKHARKKLELLNGTLCLDDGLNPR